MPTFDLGVWYKHHLKLYRTAPETRTAPEEQRHWDQLFASTDSNMVFHMLLDIDDPIQTVRYFEYLKHADPSHAYTVFENVWKDVVRPLYKNCANAIHELLSAPSAPTATQHSVVGRLEDMLNNYLHQLALNHWDCRANGPLSWMLLERLMSLQNNINDGTWVGALKSLDIYLQKGGNWENANTPNEHVLLTEWPNVLMDYGDATRLQQLFERGITLKNFSPHHANKNHMRLSRQISDSDAYRFFEEVYSSHINKKIAAEIVHVTPSASVSRKM